MVKVIELNGIKYCLNSSILSTGNCSWNILGNAIDPEKAPITLVIPCYVNKHKVKIIGESSFNSIKKLQYVVIQARITEIRGFAFCNLPNLRRINIPNTCTFIGSHAIQAYNKTATGPGNGTLSIFIEKNSSLKKLVLEAFSYKQYINVYTCEAIAPSAEQNLFYLSEETHIYSPVSFILNYGSGKSIQSEPYNETHCYNPPVCYPPKIITCMNKYNIIKNSISCYIIIVTNK